MKTKEITTIALPNGEMRKPFEEMLDKAGITYTKTSDRSYKVTFKTLGIQGVLARASDGPRLMNNPESKAVACITGEDIMVESGVERLYEEYPTSWQIPLYEITPKAPRPIVYVGATPPARERFGTSPTIQNLGQGKIATAYPELTRQYLESQGLDNPFIEEYRGSIEGLSMLIPGILWIIDIAASGKTMEANDITLVDTVISTVQLMLIQNKAKMSPLDKQRIEDLQAELVNAAEDQKILKGRSLSWI